MCGVLQDVCAEGCGLIPFLTYCTFGVTKTYTTWVISRWTPTPPTYHTHQTLSLKLHTPTSLDSAKLPSSLTISEGHTPEEGAEDGGVVSPSHRSKGASRNTNTRRSTNIRSTRIIGIGTRGGRNPRSTRRNKDTNTSASTPKTPQHKENYDGSNTS